MMLITQHKKLLTERWLGCMSSKDELLFLESNRCGSLYYHNVYSYYDEPLIFTALNEFGQLFFCYSLGCDETHDRWIVVPTSQERVNRLEQKDIHIVQMIKQSAVSKVLLVRIDLDSFDVTEDFTLAKKLPYKMPEEHVYIRENVNYDEAHEAWRKRKHELACQWAEIVEDPRLKQALRNRYKPS